MSGDVGISCVLDATLAGASADELRRVIEEYASAGARTRRSYEQRRLEAVNYRGNAGGDDETPTTPLRAAHDARRGSLVGFLLEAGADATTAGFDPTPVVGPTFNSLTLAIFHGQLDAMRALLRSGRHDADERVPYSFGAGRTVLCQPLHHAIWSPRLRRQGTLLEAIGMLVREFGVDVNARDARGLTPLMWLALDNLPRADLARAVDALLSLGADIDAGDDGGHTVLHIAAWGDSSVMSLFLSRGASTSAREATGITPLMVACISAKPAARASIPILLRASSRETLLAVREDGCSALDILLMRTDPVTAIHRAAIEELMLAGATVQPERAPSALPHAARLGARLSSNAAAAARGPTTWQGHDAMVQLAFDVEEVRVAEAGVRAREARVAELERELARLGVGEEDEGGEGSGEGGSGSGG